MPDETLYLTTSDMLDSTSFSVIEILADVRVRYVTVLLRVISKNNLCHQSHEQQTYSTGRYCTLLQYFSNSFSKNNIERRKSYPRTETGPRTDLNGKEILNVREVTVLS